MNELRIYFSSGWQDAASPCLWALCDSQGAVLQSGEGPLAAMPKSQTCTAILAADRVLCIPAQPPKGARKRWYAALPYMAEAHTLNEPEDNHVVPARARGADASVTLQVVDKHWLRRLVEAVRGAGLDLQRVIAESVMPALPENGWTLVWDGTQGFLRRGRDDGLALDSGDVATSPLSLSLALRQEPRPSSIEVRVPVSVTAELPQWADMPALVAGAPWDWRREPLRSDALNLLWGEFQPAARLGAWWPVLRPAAWVLLGALLVEAVSANLEWALLAHDKTQTAREVTQVFRDVLGNGVMQVDAPLQVQRQLAQLRHQAGQADPGDFLPLIDAVSEILSSLPAGSVRELRYEAGRIEATVRLPGAGAGESAVLQERLRRRGIGVIAGDAKEVGGWMEMRLLLSRQGGV